MSQDKHHQHEFRIIAGQLKGRVIRAPDMGKTRPPLTRLRKAIFDFLNPFLESGRYLDLFSGTGSYLFEAVSRGAASAVGVELEPVLANAINQQAAKYDVADRLICLCGDVFEVIPKLLSEGRKFDVIMTAPPQYKRIIDQTLTVLREHDLRSDDAIVLCQHDTSETKKIDFQDWEIWQRRKYGNTTYTILR